MEGGGRQSRLLSRLLGKLRGDHHHRYPSLEKRYSVISTTMSGNTVYFGSATNVDDALNPSSTVEQSLTTDSDSSPTEETFVPDDDATNLIDGEKFAANVDLRYGGQYLTPEQLPEFCDQLHNLVEVIRNIQSYAKVTGEYPSTLERRLEQEAQEVAILAAEARNARDVVNRTREQRLAVRAQRKFLTSHLATLKETEIRELESAVRLSDRKMFKSWESLKDSTDAADFEPLLEEIKNKQTALDCLVRLIEGRRSQLARNATAPSSATPLPPPMPAENNSTNEVPNGASASTGPKRHDGRRSGGGTKRRRKDSSATREPHSVPLSVEASNHSPQVTLFIQGTEHTSRYRVGSAGAVAITPLELPSRGSVRDILFFTSN